jgi:hypothetical protein
MSVRSACMRKASNILSVLDPNIGALAACVCDGAYRVCVMSRTEGTAYAACTGAGRHPI